MGLFQKEYLKCRDSEKAIHKQIYSGQMKFYNQVFISSLWWEQYSFWIGPERHESSYHTKHPLIIKFSKKTETLF